MFFKQKLNYRNPVEFPITIQTTFKTKYQTTMNNSLFQVCLRKTWCAQNRLYYNDRKYRNFPDVTWMSNYKLEYSLWEELGATILFRLQKPSECELKVEARGAFCNIVMYNIPSNF